MVHSLFFEVLKRDDAFLGRTHRAPLLNVFFRNRHQRRCGHAVVLDIGGPGNRIEELLVLVDIVDGALFHSEFLGQLASDPLVALAFEERFRNLRVHDEHFTVTGKQSARPFPQGRNREDDVGIQCVSRKELRVGDDEVDLAMGGYPFRHGIRRLECGTASVIDYMDIDIAYFPWSFLRIRRHRDGSRASIPRIPPRHDRFPDLGFIDAVVNGNLLDRSNSRGSWVHERRTSVARCAMAVDSGHMTGLAHMSRHRTDRREHLGESVRIMGSGRRPSAHKRHRPARGDFLRKLTYTLPRDAAKLCSPFGSLRKTVVGSQNIVPEIASGIAALRHMLRIESDCVRIEKIPIDKIPALSVAIDKRIR